MTTLHPELTGCLNVVLRTPIGQRILTPEEAQSMVNAGTAVIARRGVIKHVEAPVPQATRRGTIKYQYRTRRGFEWIKHPCNVVAETNCKFRITFNDRIFRYDGLVVDPGDELTVWKGQVELDDAKGASDAS